MTEYEKAVNEVEYARELLAAAGIDANASLSYQVAQLVALYNEAKFWESYHRKRGNMMIKHKGVEK